MALNSPLWITVLCVISQTIGPVHTEECDTYDVTQVYSYENDQNWLYISRPNIYALLEMGLQVCYTWGYRHTGINNDKHCLCSNKDGPWKPCTNGSEPLEIKVYKSAPKDKTFIGCYKDKGLTWKPPGTYKNHSITSCKDSCQKNGYLYASMRKGQECQCINRVYEKEEDRSTECNMTCQLMPTEVCGGPQHLSLYSTELPRSAVADDRYIGCYTQVSIASLQPYNPGQYSSTKECLDTCLSSQYDYSMIREDDKQCYCLFVSPWSESPEPLPEASCDTSITEEPMFRFYFTKASSSTTTPESTSMTSTATSTTIEVTTSANSIEATTGVTPANAFDQSSSTATTPTTTSAQTISGMITPTQETSASTMDGGAPAESTTSARTVSNASAEATKFISPTTLESTTPTTRTSNNMSSTTSSSSSVMKPSTTSSSASVTNRSRTIAAPTPTLSNESGSQRKVVIDGTRIIIGSIIGGLILIVIIIFIAYTVMRSKRNARGQPEDPSTCYGTCFGGGKTSMVDKKYSKPIWKANLNDYVIQNMQRRNHFKEEYKIIPSGFYTKAEVGRRPENLNSKNRFKNVLPYDDSRVVLSTDTGATDYINASHIKNYHGKRTFIAAQGPKDGTVIDFWRMIWQENVPIIVMLTEQAETGYECANYWPSVDENSVEYGSIKVTLRHETKYPFHYVRNFHVQKGANHKTVLQFQYTDWPDHGVPEAPSTLVSFYEDVQRNFDASIGPCVVHCSAGVGRTGTYLALDFLLDQAKSENKVDIMACVYGLRKQRVNIVQTSTQYVFLHAALNHMLTLEITSVPVERFTVYFQSIRQITTDGYSKLEEQYKMLETTKLHFKKDEMSDALSEVNRGKNRTESVVPRNHHRPGLETAYDGGTGYINAVVLDCYMKQHAFLVTQLPMESTRSDLWCLAHDFGSSVILALDCPEESFYWPAEEEETVAYGPFTIKCTHIDEVTSYITKYKLEVKKSGQALDVTLLLLDWSTDDVGPVSDLLKMHSIVQGMEKTTDDIYPILVQCRTGYERSGLYCVLSNAIKMLKVEKRADIFQCVQTARTRRPQFIKSLNQYRFIHDAIKVYINKG